MKKKLLIISMIFVLIIGTSNLCFADKVYDYEPNDTLETAIDPNTPIYNERTPLKSTITSYDDMDYYKEKFPKNGYVTMQLTSPKGHNYDFYVLYKEDTTTFNEVKEIANSYNQGNTDTVTFPVTEGRYYYFVIFTMDTGSNEYYELKTINYDKNRDAAYELGEYHDEDAKDDYETAYDVDIIHKNVIATITDYYDLDYYKFCSEYTGEMKLGLIPPSKLNYDIIVAEYDTGEELAHATAEGKHVFVTFDAVRGEKYCIHIYGNDYNDYGPGLCYQLFCSQP